MHQIRLTFFVCAFAFRLIMILSSNVDIPGGTHGGTFVWVMVHLMINVSPCISTYSLACRDVCGCTSDVISCTRSNLREIPRFDYLGSTLGTARSLYLDNNHISVVGNGTFQGLELVTSIDLSRNKIRSIARNAFAELPTLLILRMNNNLVSSLHFVLTNQLTLLSLIENEIEFFNWTGDTLHGAQNLALSGNKIVSIKNTSFPKSVTRLYLEHNKIRYIAYMVFNDLSALEELNLSYNFIQHLPYLGSLQSLRILFLNFNNLFSVDSGALIDSTEISVINMGNNPNLNDLGWIENSSQEHLTKLDSLHYSYTLLDLTSLMSLDGLSSVSKLYAIGCGLSIVSSFPRLQKVDGLFLSRNKITNIFLEFFSRIPTVKNLYLDRNLISNLSFLRSPNEIESLSLHSNNIHILYTEDFIWMSKLRRLHLESNHIQLVPKLRGMNLLTALYLENNRIAVITKNAFEGIPLITLCLSYNTLLEPYRSSFTFLGHLEITETLFDTARFNKIFSSVNALRYLIVNRNIIQHIKYLPGLQKLYSLEVSMNEISNISDDAFKDMKNLRVLKLRQNAITTLAAFQGLPKLMTLNLAGNKILEIDQTFFNGTLSLWMLSLHDNLITEIDSFPRLPVLTNLFLGRNRIQIINPLAGFSHSIRFLDLSHNFLSDISFVDKIISLQEFLVYNNAIGYVHSRVFQNLTSLRILNLAFNDIHFIDPITVSEVTRFSLNISGNAIDQVDDLLILQSLETHVVLAASSNNIRAINVTRMYSNNFVALFVSDNPIRRIHFGLQPHRIRLRILVANNVELPYHEVHKLSKNHNAQIMQLNRATQFIKGIPSGNASSYPRDFPDLIQLMLENNALKSFPRLFLANLIILSLRFNEITYLSEDDFLTYTPKLGTFFAEGNRITYLDGALFDVIGPSLKFLYLNNNSIRNISTLVFSNLPNLLTLQLENNELTSLPELFDSVPRKRRNIYLGGNPLVCDVGLHWVKLIEDTAGIFCQNCTCTCPSSVDDYATRIVPLNALTCPLVLTTIGPTCQTYRGALHQIRCPSHSIPAPIISWNVHGIPPHLRFEVENEMLIIMHRSRQDMRGMEECEYDIVIACRAVSVDSELSVSMVVNVVGQPNHKDADLFWSRDPDTSNESPESSLFSELDDTSSIGRARETNGTLFSSEIRLEDDLDSADWEYSHPELNESRSFNTTYECSSTVINFTLTSSNPSTSTQRVSVFNRANRMPFRLYLFSFVLIFIGYIHLLREKN